MFNTISYYGFCSFLAQAFFVAFLHKYIKSHKFFEVFSIVLSLSIFSLTFVKSHYSLLFIVPLFSLAYSVLLPSLTYLLSESALENHGKTMGLNQSVQALAKILAPALAGCSLAFTSLASVVISALVILASAVVFGLSRKDSVSPSESIN
jgi:predicted MFS family arabinose efflux permease